MTGTTGVSGSSNATLEAKAAEQQTTLGKDDFLRLLVAQLRHQNPLDPMEEKEFMGQMAQFSTLEQVTNMAAELQRVAHASQVSGSVGLIGRTVEYELEDGSFGQGVVDSVSFEDGRVLLHVGGAEVEPAAVRSVVG